jgi:signal peptide peptidase SppA|tara:strand:- start:10017 stop:11402 length:1386 start_codon:yes stop_codon:yes gene_type:complete
MKLLDVLNSPWAIMPDKLNEIRDVYLSRLNREKIDLKALKEELGRPLGSQLEEQVVDGVSIIPIEGVIAKRMNMFSNVSGGTSIDLIENAFIRALNNENVHTILLHIDSQGGTVAGTQEFASLVYQSRDQKRIVSVADGMMASAALWIGVAAHEVFITGDTAQIGSIGVVATHIDVSERDKMEGVKTTEIASGKFKSIASEHKTLTEEARDVIQDQVDELFSIFVRDVAAFRDIEVDALLDGIADGRIFIGQKAVKTGLVDGVQPFRSLLTQLVNENGDSPAPIAFVNVDKGDSGMPNQGESTTTAISTVAGLSSAYPDLVTQIKEEALSDGFAKGKQDELDRIQAVQTQSLSGHEDLIESLKFDGKTTGPEAAVAVLEAEKRDGEKAKESLASGSIEALPPVVDVSQDEKTDYASMSVEDKAKAMWKDNADQVQDVFPNQENFLAYLEATTAGKAMLKTG